MCLGLMEDSDVIYELSADYKFYIETSLNTLKQRFLDKLTNYKVEKNGFLKNGIKIQKIYKINYLDL